MWFVYNENKLVGNRNVVFITPDHLLTSNYSSVAGNGGSTSLNGSMVQESPLLAQQVRGIKYNTNQYCKDTKQNHRKVSGTNA